MRKIYAKILQGLCLSGVLLTASCQKDQNVFSTTPAERTSQSLQEALTTLQSSVYGWKMTLYPSKDKKYGGYTLFVQFDKDGTLSSSDELQAKDDVVYRSQYSVDNSNGPTLIFNTYSKSIHRYSEPNSKDFTENLAFGADGDYSYRIISLSPEKVVLKGVRTGTEATLTPIKTAGWDVLVKAQKEAADIFQISVPVFKIKGEVVKGAKMTNKRHLVFTYKGKSYNEPYNYTDTGISFYKPFTVDGITVSSLVNKTNSDDPRLEDATAQISITSSHVPYDILIGSRWHYTQQGSQGRFQQAFSRINTFLTRYGGKVNDEYVFFGFTNGHLSVFTSKFEYGTDKFAPLDLHLQAEKISENEIKITYDLAATTANPDSWNSALVPFRCASYLAMGFSNIGTINIPENWRKPDGPTYFYKDDNAEGRTFTIEVEPGKARPTWIKLTDKQDPENVVVLKK